MDGQETAKARINEFEKKLIALMEEYNVEVQYSDEYCGSLYFTDKLGNSCYPF